MSMTNRKGKKRSSYKNKAPFQYSAIYSQWKSAVRAGRRQEADELSRQHLAMCARQSPLLARPA